ncbi:2'-5' RNA ligase family protein [Streptomyces sp. NPDC008343]|uniref:2'-5' RNA ligase family protein n=1 Tax=Streptomyces sp. NPDC008343 TaxID=3364828 RepID=UPI0036E5DB8A
MTSGQTTNAFICLRIPGELADALVDLQQRCRNRVDPQNREHMHITLGFLHDADEQKLTKTRALLTEGAWPAPAVRLTGNVRHGSWALAKNPAYRYDEEVVQKGEQVRLGVEHNDELRRIQEEITQGLDIVERDFWPHVTLGLAVEDFPAAEVRDMPLPTVSAPAPSVDVQQEVSAVEFTTLVRKELPGP